MPPPFPCSAVVGSDQMVELNKVGSGWSRHDLYLLHEFTYPLNWGWIVATGRRADPKLVEAADLVTEMTKVKHPMDAGQKGQRGIEW